MRRLAAVIWSWIASGELVLAGKAGARPGGQEMTFLGVAAGCPSQDWL